ncbi:MAG: T9SS type A sorting domain-containing protein, partial [Saprospiraceae bacterium]
EGTLYDCSALFADFGTACDDNNPNTYLDKITENCECEGTPMFNFGTVSSSVNSSDNDAEEYSDGTVKTTSTDLEMVEEGSKQTVGVRFENVTIPNGATLLAAYLQFTTDQTDDKITKLNIFGEASSAPTSYTTTDHNITTRLKTNSIAEWAVAPWNTDGEKSDAQRSPNLKQIIAEQLGEEVDEPFDNWFPNNSLAFVIEGTGKRVAISYDGEADDAPQLVLEYAFGCADGDADGICDSDDDCPDVAGTIGSSCNDGNSLTVNDIIDENCNCAGVVNTASQTLSTAVRRASDDAEQGSNGYVSIYSTDLEMMVDNGVQQTVGIRFDEVNLPVGAAITSAYIQFTGDESTATDPCVLTIYGEASNNSSTFSTQSENISSRTKTNASVQWSPNTIWQVNENSQALRTSNLAPIIFEIISINGFDPNNAITFIIDGYGNRVASSFDKNPDSAPVLIINYNLGCPDTDNDGICDSDDACPTIPGVPGTPCDDGNPSTINDVINDGCNCVGTLPSGSTCSRINYVTDDAEQRIDGRVKLHSTDIELVKDVDDQWVGLRFNDLDLPPGVSILDARIQFTADEKENEPGTIIIQGELGDSPATFADIDYSISDRPLSNNSVTWSPEEWEAEGDSGDAQQSTDISAIIQEIVNQGDYNLNDPIVILLHGTGKRVARSFNGSFPAEAPELCIEYDLTSVNNAIIHEQEQADTGDLSHKKRITLYPNPASQQLTVKFNRVLITGEARIEITDHTGKRVIVEERELYEQQQTSLDVSLLSSGLYSLQVFVGKNHYAGKFIVIRD